jgi:hypothetical protein
LGWQNDANSDIIIILCAFPFNQAATIPKKPTKNCSFVHNFLQYEKVQSTWTEMRNDYRILITIPSILITIPIIDSVESSEVNLFLKDWFSIFFEKNKNSMQAESSRTTFGEIIILSYFLLGIHEAINNLSAVLPFWTSYSFDTISQSDNHSLH